MEALAAQLAAFDRMAPAACTFLRGWLALDDEALIAMARGRLVEGHFRFPSQPLYDMNRGELLAETAQELADAIVYAARRLDLA